MADLNKQNQLEDLQKRMKRDFGLWFFSSENDVDGYLGTDPIVFVGIRPSTGKGGFARPIFNSFYDRLKRHGFAHAHVTDLVKESMRVGYPTDEQVDRNWPYFLEELSIVDPVVIVALGGWVFKQLENRRDDLEDRLNRQVTLKRVTHYSYRYGSREKLGKRFDDEFERLAQSLKGREGGS